MAFRLPPPPELEERSREHTALKSNEETQNSSIAMRFWVSRD